MERQSKQDGFREALAGARAEQADSRREQTLKAALGTLNKEDKEKLVEVLKDWLREK